MQAKFFEKDGREFFSFIGKSHVVGVPADEYVDFATEDHKVRFPSQYKDYLKSKQVLAVVEEVKEVVESVEEAPAKKKGFFARKSKKVE